MISEELHLFIVWNKAGAARDTALHRIAETFSILRAFHIHWSPNTFSDNLTRFYGQHLPPGCEKEKSCGIGPFTLVVVRDNHPQYAVRETTRGPAFVNTRTFDLKSHLRSAPGGWLPVHATNTPRETNHDLALLLGLDAPHFEHTYPGSWNGQILELHREISGARGWASYRELFFVLNATVDYVVLRNFDDLPDQHTLELHGDIDLLAGNYVDAILVANARPLFTNPYNVHHAVVIAGQPIPFDFRYVGDNYYDARWEHQILASRRLTKGSFYTPDEENHFFSLLYHAAVHKKTVAPDYAIKLKRLANNLGIALPSGEFFDDPRQLRRFLQDFMSPRRYRFTPPHDPSVYFRRSVALNPLQRITGHFLPVKAPPPVPTVPRLSNQPATLNPSLLSSLGLPDETIVIDFDHNRSTLSDCCSQLPDDGVLVIITNNRFGIRQFNGLTNGPSDLPYSALYGLESALSSNRKLKLELEEVGLCAYRYYYPFPDHKHPKAILAEQALRENEFAASNLLALMVSQDPTGRTHPAFYEHMVWQSVMASGLLPDLANDFVVIAAKNEAALTKLDESWLARTFTPDRLPPFQTETTFRHNAQGRIVVEKRALSPGNTKASPPYLAGESLLMHHTGTITDYVPGNLYVTELQKRLARGEGIASVIDWATDWLNLLRAHATGTPKELPGTWLDAVPQNFIRSIDGTLHPIDDEWELSTPIPCTWLIIRGLYNALGVSPTSPALAGLSMRETIQIVAASVNIDISEKDFASAFALEARLRSVVFGQDEEKTLGDLAMAFALPPQANVPTHNQVFMKDLIRENDQLAREIARVKATVSWQITKPLRFLANLPRLTRKQLESSTIKTEEFHH